MNYIEEYRKYLERLTLLTRDAFVLNIYLLNFINSSAEEIADDKFVFISIFSKIVLHSDSILKILPKDTPENLYSQKEFKLLDLSSVASLTRDIIDADNTLFYLFTERVDASERDFRLTLFNLHGHMRWREIVCLIDSYYQEETVVRISEKIDNLKKQLEMNSFFKDLEKETTKNSSKGKRAKEIFKKKEEKIENVKDAVFSTRKQIAEVRMMDTSVFDAVYAFLSSHVHSFSIGTSLVGHSILMDEKALLFLLLTIKNASFYLCLAMIDTVILFQGAEEKLSLESRGILQSIIRGESYVI